MKHLKFSLLIVAVILLGFSISFWPRSTQTPQKDTESPRELAEKSTPPEVAALPPVGSQSVSQPSSVHTPSSKLSENASGFERFNEWASRYVAASKEQRSELVEEGIKIARERRAELRGLIETDPRRAIENAVPPVLRQQLPLALAELLEERVNEMGFYGVIGVMPSAEYPKTPPYRREVRTSDGGRYRATTCRIQTK